MATIIRYAIQAGNALPYGGTLTDAELVRLARETAAAISAAFPGAEVECPIERTSGVRAAGYTRVSGAYDIETIGERLDEIAHAAWLAWARTLPETDLDTTAIPDPPDDEYGRE